jgi:ribosomal protein L3 glutamine methyltransferase
LTLEKLIAKTQKQFKRARLHYGHGTDNAHDEAAYLVLRGLGLPFDVNLNQPLGRAQLARIERLVAGRIKRRIPVAYLVREAWLDGHAFYVDRRSIVPRSHIAALLHEIWFEPPVRRVLDLCTGSGCLAILAALKFARAQVDATDLSPTALGVARKNVARYRLQRRVAVSRSDIYESLAGRRYDLILANPPYVTAAAMRKLPAEYRHEPRFALAGGDDGLELVSRILEDAPRHLQPGGLLVCEVGENRRALERAYPRAPMLWPQPEVFMFSLQTRSRRARAGAARTARGA